MKKVFTFKQAIMNGTVTMQTIVCSFTSKVLAEKTRQAVIEANKDIDFPKSRCYEVEETDVYESEDEVPILQDKTNKNE